MNRERSRRWTWTLYPQNDEETNRIRALLPEENPWLRYLIFGVELAPSTGRMHLQGYVEFKNPQSLIGVKKLLSPRLNCQVSKGTAAENKAYCSKDGKVTEIGSPTNQGSRTDIHEIQAMIEDGATDFQIAQTHFSQWTRMRTAIQDYRRMVFPKVMTIRFTIDQFPQQWQDIIFPEEEMVTIFHGPSGIGKTCFVKALAPTAMMVTHTDDLRHFNADEHEAIIFDDMDFKHLPRTSQIHLVDSDDDRSIHCRYATATIPANTRKYFTTNEPEGRIFNLEDPAIRRRVKVRYLDLPRG